MSTFTTVRCLPFEHLDFRTCMFCIISKYAIPAVLILAFDLFICQLWLLLYVFFFKPSSAIF